MMTRAGEVRSMVLPVASSPVALRDVPLPFPEAALHRLDNGAATARIAGCGFADAAIFEVDTSPVRLLRPCGAGAPEGYQLVLHIAGHGRYRSGDRELRHGPGDIALLDLDGEAPFEVVHPEGVHLLCWSLPRAILAPLLPRERRSPVTLIPSGEPMGDVLWQHAQRLAVSAGRGFAGPVEAGLVVNLCGLVALAVGALSGPRAGRRRGYRAHMRQRALDYIAAHRHDPALTAARAAAELGMSRRWLHALVRDAGPGFAALVVGWRLRDSLERLRDPDYAEVSVAEIAYQCGFNDLSTFYRRFRQRFGCTPLAARRAASRSCPVQEKNRQ